MLLLHNVILQVDKDDRWLWTLDSSKVFTVRSAYNFLTFQPPIASPVAVVVSSLWHKDVPLKVVLFAWRLFRDRLPTKDNLIHRGVIDQDSRLCVAGCGSVEPSHHLFLHCNILGMSSSLSIVGLAFPRQSLFMCQTTLINSAIAVVSQRHVVRSVRPFGLVRFGKFGKKEITGFLTTKNAR